MRPARLTRLCLALITLAAADAGAQEGQAIYLDAVPLRADVTSDLHLRVYQNPAIPCRAGGVLAIHGAGATAASLEPLAQALLSPDRGGPPTCRVITLDLPGHGQSGLPVGAPFGALTVADYAEAVIQTLERLPALGLRPTTLVGHSMGGLVIQVAQDRLLQRGGSLRADHRIQQAVLLSPALPDSVPWHFRDSGAALTVAGFARQDPELGEVLDIPPAVFVPVAFSRLDGTLPASTPSAEVLVSGGYIGLESMAAAGSFFGLEAYPQIDVAPGGFAPAHQTRLHIVALGQDTLITPTDLAALYPYLTGEAAAAPGLVLVDHPDATHGLPIADPQLMLEAIGGSIRLR